MDSLARFLSVGIVCLIVSPAADAQDISAPQAITEAQKIAGADWKFMFVSNTGVTQSVSLSRSPADALMKPNGRAGQWVFELVKDTPKPYKEGVREGFEYPLKIMGWNAGKFTNLPDSAIAMPRKPTFISTECLGQLEQARMAAVQATKVKFDLMSIANESDGCTWDFRFYDLQRGEVVARQRFKGPIRLSVQ